MNRDDLLSELTFLSDIGFKHLDVRPDPRLVAEVSAKDHPVVVEPGDPPTEEIAKGAHTLDSLGRLAAGCLRCRLASTRTQVVFGTGNPDADLMFIGEGPGRDEDLKGEPFVGRAGQLLTDIIKAMQLTREAVYITNVVKCRPPENRNPENDEMDACRPYLQRQIELIKPKVIVTLGRFALQSTLQKSVSISNVRGTWQEHGSIRLMPTYHPAYLLRTPSAKKEVWADMKKVMAELGIDPPAER